jgi:ABC-type sulfate/molybdate transport systems ATPase subunit
LDLSNLAAFLFNIGINVCVVFYFSVYNKSRIDLRLKNLLKTFGYHHHTTLLISSHDLNQVIEVCERMVILENGLIVQDMETTTNTLQELQAYFTV